MERQGKHFSQTCVPWKVCFGYSCLNLQNGKFWDCPYSLWNSSLSAAKTRDGAHTFKLHHPGQSCRKNEYCILFVLPIFIEFVSCLHVIPLFFGCQSAMSCCRYLSEKGKCKLWFTFVVFFTSPMAEDYWGLGHMGLLEHLALAAVLKLGVEAGGTKLKTWPRPLPVRNSKP